MSIAVDFMVSGCVWTMGANYLPPTPPGVAAANLNPRVTVGRGSAVAQW